MLLLLLVLGAQHGQWRGSEGGRCRIEFSSQIYDVKTAKDRFVVTPNNVTIDAYALIDVSKEPVVLSVPALSEPRWYLVQMGDSFDEVFQNLGGSDDERLLSRPKPATVEAERKFNTPLLLRLALPTRSALSGSSIVFPHQRAGFGNAAWRSTGRPKPGKGFCE